MRLLPLLVIIVAAVMAVVWLLNNASERRTIATSSRRSSLPARTDADVEEAAAVLHGPDRGPGVLRLTPSQLLFAGDAGRVLAVDRWEITGATTTTELPDHQRQRPVLAVSTADDVYYFAVNDPEAWQRRLG